MKTLSHLICLLSLTLVLGRAAVAAPGQDPAVIAAVAAADDQRVAAMRAGERPGLEAILSDELRYAHSNGKVDTKASFIDTLAGRKTIYESLDYQERNIVLTGSGGALMSGRVIVHLRNGTEPLVLDLNFLAVWRQENGQWRFLAWQSCRNPAPAAAAK